MTGAKVGSGLFPAISGKGGVQIKYNLGHNPVERPMVHKPPSEQFTTVAAAVSCQVIQLAFPRKSSFEICY